MDITKARIDAIKQAVREEAGLSGDDKHVHLAMIGLDLLCGFLLDVKTIADNVGRSDDAILAVAARKARELDQ